MKIYVVQWIRPLFDLKLAGVDCDDRTIAGATQPQRLVQSFRERDAAEQFRLQCEALRKPPIILSNPFELGDEQEDLAALTSMPDKILGDWVREVGLEPPPVAPRRPDGKGRHLPLRPRLWDWAEWWRRSCREMTELQRIQVYHALDKVNFLEVIELELEQ